MISRRGFLEALLATPVLASTRVLAAPAIDRYDLVTRHNPRLTKIDPLSPLSLGNGEFAFTADVTGLQTFPRLYADAMPLCTMSQWGWHTRPLPSSIQSQTLRPRLYETYGRKVGYNTSSEGQTELFNWLRENPHRLHLGQIGLCLPGREIDRGGISEINQELDLWRGVLNSQFKLFGEPVSITTAVHPIHELLAVVIDSRLPDVAVRVKIPYGSPSMQAAEWNQPEKHQTRIIADEKDRTLIRRELDGNAYYVTVQGQLLGAFGVLPGDGVDKETMRRTLRETMQRWQWEKTWGWDYPMTAMTAARLGESSIAIDALMMKTEKNRYLTNGHNWQRPNLPCYLPGNGGLLYAIAMMAGGWKGGPKTNAPGFPSDGSWTVRSENFRLPD